MHSSLAKILRLPCPTSVRMIGLYFYSSAIISLIIATAGELLRLLGSLITDADLPFSEWKPTDFLAWLWSILFTLGCSTEVLTYAGWLLINMYKGRRIDSLKYGFPVWQVWWLVTMDWTIGSCLRFVLQLRDRLGVPQPYYNLAQE